MQVVLQDPKDQDHLVPCNPLSPPLVPLSTMSRRPAQPPRAHSSLLSTGFLPQDPPVKGSLNRVIATQAHKAIPSTNKPRRSNKRPAVARLLEVHPAGLAQDLNRTRLAHRSPASSVSLPARKLHSLAGPLFRSRKLVPQPG